MIWLGHEEVFGQGILHGAGAASIEWRSWVAGKLNNDYAEFAT